MKRDSFFEKSFQCINKFFEVFATISFLLVSFCVLTQVITRYTPGFSAPWTDEMTRLFFLYSIMFGAPMAIKYKEYAAIDILTARAKAKMQVILCIITHIIITIVSIIGVFQAHILFKTGFRNVSTTLRIPMWIFYIIPVGIFLFTFLYSISEVYVDMKKLKEKKYI